MSSKPLRTALLGALLVGLSPIGIQAAELADEQAMANAVALYEQGALPQAQARFEALAKAGKPAAMHNLAVMHLRGELPDASVDKAEKLLEDAAGRGFVTAQLALGELFESSRLGKPDLHAALTWYNRAAAAGSVDGQVAVATAYFMGRGTPRDAAQAAQWYRLAATRGDVGAQYILASLYEKGDGVSADLRLARYWYAAAANQGDQAAPDKVKEIDFRIAADRADSAAPPSDAASSARP